MQVCPDPKKRRVQEVSSAASLYVLGDCVANNLAPVFMAWRRDRRGVKPIKVIVTGNVIHKILLKNRCIAKNPPKAGYQMVIIPSSRKRRLVTIISTQPLQNGQDSPSSPLSRVIIAGGNPWEGAMTNYFVSYDLNGKTPTHAQMDEHLKKLGKCVLRVLETVWYVRSSKTVDDMYSYVNSVLSKNDGVLIIVAGQASWRNLLVTDQALLNCWEQA